MTPPIPVSPVRVLPYFWPVFLCLLGFIIYTFTDVLIKIGMQDGFPFYAVIFIYSLSSITVAVLYAFMMRQPSLLRTKKLPVHLGRAILNLCAINLGFYSIFNMPLSQAYTLFLTGPIFIALLAAILQKERIWLSQWGALILCFAGVVLFFRPGLQMLQLAMFFPLAAALFSSLSTMVVRMHKSEHPVAFNFYFGLVAFCVNLPLVIFLNVEFTWFYVLMIGLAGLLAMGTTLIMFWAHQNAPAILVSPLQYSQLIWGCIVGYLIWNDIPDIWALGAMGLITASGLYLIISSNWRKAKRDKLI